MSHRRHRAANLAYRRTERRYRKTVLRLQRFDSLNRSVGKHHRVLNALASIDKPQRVIPEAQSCESTELLLGRFLVGRFISDPLSNTGGIIMLFIASLSTQRQLARSFMIFGAKP